jgi:uncharacterized protein (DUF58 family)
MTIKHIGRAAAAAAALAALAVWGATSVGAASFEHRRAATAKPDRQLTRQLAQMRVATALYATDLEKAKADGKPFVFWHPRLVTLHVWIWYPNPDGLYASTNPLARPFNAG